jgi:hypothetical protein
VRPVPVQEEGLEEDRRLPVQDEEEEDDHGVLLSSREWVEAAED